jgi:putative transposase
MPEYRRSRIDTTYFFTVVTENRTKILTSPQARAALKTAFTETQMRMPFHIEAIVLLPEHLHTIWTLPGDDSDYSKRWAYLKKTFTQQYLQGGGLERHSSNHRECGRSYGVWMSFAHPYTSLYHSSWVEK